jgi:hypothetical protein
MMVLSLRQLELEIQRTSSLMTDKFNGEREPAI